MTPDQQARERLAREATPGPWVACLSDRYGHGVPSRAVVAFFEAQHGCQRGLFTEVPWPDGEPAPRRSGDADAKHIAANSPSVILADIVHIRALEREVESLDYNVKLHDEARRVMDRQLREEQAQTTALEAEVARLRSIGDEAWVRAVTQDACERAIKNKAVTIGNLLYYPIWSALRDALGR